jgi:hypothetical protein
MNVRFAGKDICNLFNPDSEYRGKGNKRAEIKTEFIESLNL